MGSTAHIRKGKLDHGVPPAPARNAQGVGTDGEDEMPTLLDDLLAWCRSEREALQDQLRLLESGVMKTGEHRLGSSPRDTTAESIARARRQIEELDKILARHPDV